MTARFVGVAGLPRSASTLLCQLLAGHPDIHSEGYSSPLCSVRISGPARLPIAPSCRGVARALSQIQVMGRL
ncbi:MAG TPA: hypothetical protein VGH81_15260 [Rudaea sp.]|jgi:hypothetical protein